MPDPPKNTIPYDYYYILYYYYCLLYLYYLLFTLCRVTYYMCLFRAIHSPVSILSVLSSGVGRHYTLRPAPSVSCHIVLPVLYLALIICALIITILLSFVFNHSIFILLTPTLLTLYYYATLFAHLAFWKVLRAFQR